MGFDAAVVREQGVTFTVVAVKSRVVNSDSSRREAMSAFAANFPGVPIVLMVQDGTGRPMRIARALRATTPFGP